MLFNKAAQCSTPKKVKQTTQEGISVPDRLLPIELVRDSLVTSSGLKNPDQYELDYRASRNFRITDSHL